MPFCPKCGFEVTEDDNYCRECGRNLNYGRDKDVKKEQESGASTSVFDDEICADEAKTSSEPREYEYGRYGPSAIARDLLTTGEVPLLETRPLLLFRMFAPVVALTLTLVIFVVLYVYFTVAPLLYAMGFFLLVEMLWVLIRWIQWRYTVFAATNRRVLYQYGVISKSYIDCPLGKVQTVYLEVPVIGRLSDFGTIRVATAGEARVEIEWRDVKSPNSTQRILYEIIERYERSEI